MSSKDLSWPFGLRPSCPGDIPILVDLLSDLFTREEDFSPDPRKQQKGIELLLAEPDRNLVLVAEDGGEVIGLVTVQLNVSTAEGGLSGLLEDLVVRSDRRGEGWGSELLSAALAWSRHRGALRVQLLADRNNHAALEFYGRKRLAPTALVCRKIHL